VNEFLMQKYYKNSEILMQYKKDGELYIVTRDKSGKYNIYKNYERIHKNDFPGELLERIGI
jgi:hypothetical protein